MASNPRLARRTRVDALASQRDDWLRDGILSGFVATFAMTVVITAAYLFARGVGEDGGNTLQRWFWALTDNPVTQSSLNAVWLAIALNLGMGLVWALFYGRFVEPALHGPGWQKGVVFSLVPWVLSIVAFLPIMDGGFLGSNIEAGPLPVIGNLILHLVYGATLGSVFAIAMETGLDDTAEDRAAALSAERGAAIGIGAGLVIGGLLGWLLGPDRAGLDGTAQVIVAGGLSGSAIGLLLGSLVGLDGDEVPAH